jgi:hypothetical protein
VDIELILDSTEIMAPALKGTTRRILAATSSSSMGVSLELADVLARRTAGWPEVHITAAADELLTHLVAIEVNVLGEESVLMTLARIGAQAMMSRAELEDVTGPGECLIGKRPVLASEPSTNTGAHTLASRRTGQAGQLLLHNQRSLGGWRAGS